MPLLSLGLVTSLSNRSPNLSSFAVCMAFLHFYRKLGSMGTLAASAPFVLFMASPLILFPKSLIALMLIVFPPFIFGAGCELSCLGGRGFSWGGIVLLLGFFVRHLAN